MIRDRLAERQKTVSLKDKRQNTIGRIILILCLLSFYLCPIAAQSNLTYELRVGTTGEVQLLSDFPERYEGEKVNIQVQTASLIDRFADRPSSGLLDSLDFIFADEPLALQEWGDSIYSYKLKAESGKDVEWTVWQRRRDIKNRGQRVLVQNAYGTFEQYIREQTKKESHVVAWLGWILAGLLLIAGVVYALVTIGQRRKEKNLPSVEQEGLRRERLGTRRHLGSQLYLWLLLLVLYSPIALIAIFSFTESKILGNWTGFSWQLYGNLFTGKADAGLNSAIWYTLIIALVAGVVSTILGTLAAIGIYNMRARQRKMVSFLNSVPMINPDIITGISLFLLFVALGMSQGLVTVCIAHVVFCTPYVVLSVLPRLSRMNPNTYEAALDLGATPAQALRMVLLPELWPGMLSGFILAITLSVDDFGVTFFTKGSGGLETLSTFIYSDARKGGLTPELRPLFTIILIVMLAVLVFINLRDDKVKGEK